VEVFFLGARKFSSYPSGSAKGHSVDKTYVILPQLTHLRIWHSRIPARHSDDPLIAIADRNRDETLLLERSDVSSNLSTTHAEEFREVMVGGKAAALIIESVNFHEKNFFHERQFLRDPNLFGNPNSFEVALSPFHSAIVA
jgi:hypothetical protein